MVSFLLNTNFASDLVGVSVQILRSDLSIHSNQDLNANQDQVVTKSIKINENMSKEKSSASALG